MGLSNGIFVHTGIHYRLNCRQNCTYIAQARLFSCRVDTVLVHCGHTILHFQLMSMCTLYVEQMFLGDEMRRSVIDSSSVVSM